MTANCEEYELGYNDYITSDDNGRYFMLRQANIRIEDAYWRGVKDAAESIKITKGEIR